MLSIHNYCPELNEVRIDIVDQQFSKIFTPSELKKLREFFDERSDVRNLRRYLTNDLGINDTMKTEDLFVEFFRSLRTDINMSDMVIIEELQMLRF